MQKVYPDKNNIITVSCPHCSKSRRIDASPYLGRKGATRLKYRFKCSYCDCGHKDCAECKEGQCANDNSNLVLIERRKFFRKKVNLRGTLQNRENKPLQIRVLDISRTGVKTRALSGHTFQVGEKLLARFNLDDARETPVSKMIIVRKVEGRTLDGEFLETDSYDKNDKAIGFYLM